MTWLNTPAHARWLEAEADRTFEFGRNARVANGFGWLSNQGTVRAEVPTQLWITSRMVHVYSLAALMGRPGAGALVDHGIAALNGPFRDRENGGWYAAIDENGPADASKQGYQHFFVVLGAASATAAGRPGARELLDDALALIEERFWSEEQQICLESWDEAFTETEAYRGGNVNMHAVEAFLVVADVTGDDLWLRRALAIAAKVIHDVARGNSYRVVEHFDEHMQPLFDYNSDNRAHRFRAFGGTPGHWTEWSRLLLSLRDALRARGMDAPDWLQEDAAGLFEAAVRDAWEPDGHPGFVYSVDWDGQPVVRARIRWVVVEAMGGAAALHAATGDARYDEWYQRFWDYAKQYLIDTENGSWWQELSPENEVSHEVWDGKPDIYHLMHCLLVPRLPLAPAMAPALAAGLLDAAVS
ncbi:AGE family epimerase/isomerase [Microbacterium sp. No. 7]|uniref:AGE family epimerase/isomerase n=1 Tax=Microbacterium sp. No. 7 TaxID=1714373 RepID=UPI0006CF679F|nr:AGE family epimerase/isomerase [Microbacterium sp. No. 7]ALJ21988.1 sugar isomerase [Microbacterium sp. No. 7]